MRAAAGRVGAIDAGTRWADARQLLCAFRVLTHPTEEHPIWRAALDELAAVLTTENFNTWLATTRVVAQEGEVLRVAVPAAFNKTWLEQKLHGKVTGALHRIDYNALAVGRVARVEYVVEVAA